MYLFNNLPPFEPACSDTRSRSLYSVEQLIPPDYNNSQPSYHGKSVHVPELSLPAYHSHSDFCQNNVSSFHSLIEYDIDNLILTDPAATFGNELPDIQQSELGHYVPWDSDNERVEARLAPEPVTPFIPQACLSVSESETRNPIPACHWYPDHQIINLSTTPFSPQNLNQTTSYSQIPQTEWFSEGNATIVEDQRKFRNDPANDACKRQRIRNSVRYNDPADAKYLKKNREYYRKRIKNPSYAESKRKINRDYYRNRSHDPVYLERKRMVQREYIRRRKQNISNQANRQEEISKYHAYLAYEWQLRKAAFEQEINIFNQPIQW
ncbi:hypothetical protein [Endozoicomonas sp. GU-1]|uniref:hypothetical protein n=1 Tax=Endozoicomonas sp. GU-1 TaxID=3009078 RepID=UPI0022B41669|nr:hypothetical protein [Endozoicomonas sp. GU-1]WBA79788.1 hypothetical protein O2T12_15615 [Endozoicomonas sp. GU-1]WBA87369.1 hypothetical protein O3276_04875 [Endozoicomonas sp. GU-1]